MLNLVYSVYGQIGKLVMLWEKSNLAKQGPRPKRELPGHTLYHFGVSSFSATTRKAIYKMNITLPFKDVLLDKQAYRDLVKLGGKDQCPCLRIETRDGVNWMYESQDIINYLKTK